MKRTLVLLVLYSPAGEVSMVTEGYGLLDEVGAGETVGAGDGEFFAEFALSKLLWVIITTATIAIKTTATIAAIVRFRFLLRV